MVSILHFPKHSDERGELFPIEFAQNIPFPVQRVYFLKNTPSGKVRGAHCHFQEQEVFVCIAGKCRCLVDDDGKGKKEIWLDDAQKAIYIPTLVWHEFDNFSENALLLAFSSTQYFPGKENYEYDYEAFLKIVQK